MMNKLLQIASSFLFKQDVTCHTPIWDDFGSGVILPQPASSNITQFQEKFDELLTMSSNEINQLNEIQRKKIMEIRNFHQQEKNDCGENCDDDAS